MHNRNKQLTTQFIICSLLLIGVIYAILQANLQINGTAKIGANTWDIHFDNIQVNENSVSIGSGDSAATIDPENNCKVDFEVTLSIPGDFYEFTVDVVNAGTIDGMIQNYTIPNVPDYLDYSITYVDGMSLVENQLLASGTSETYKVRLEFKTDIEELPDAEILSTSFEVTCVQADNSAQTVPHPVDFATDSWDTVVAAIKSGNTSAYHVGDTKTVELGNSLGTHTIRIANTSTPAECSTTGFSQSACGFVLEFADIIKKHRINPKDVEYQGITYQYGWNVDGWPVTEMRSYLNDINEPTSILNSLPEVLRNAIIDTTLVSSHGKNTGETNFISIDKLYLLSSHEVWEDVDGNVNAGLTQNDKAYNDTRQLDYYLGLNVTTDNYTAVIKQYNNSDTDWWLRSASFHNSQSFVCARDTGYFDYFTSANELGVSPAFRIG